MDRLTPGEAAEADSEIPRRVGRYRVEGVLGEGAMAVVYAGFDPGIQRRVAIKCLHREVATDPDYRHRFLVEARAAGHLTHPNIVTIFETGQTGEGRPYIAMERLPGETLASRVDSHGLPDLPTLIELAGQLAGALDYAHAQGVVHHDIKPENIMLADGWHYAKISDFGIAERRRSRRAVVRRPGRAVGGTPAFMAPERLRGEPSDARSDLFSLGVVLYWLLTGELPWPAEEDLRALIAHRQRVPRPPIDPRDPSTPPILVDIVRTLLSPVPEGRYQRGAEVVDDLRLARREYERQRERPLTARIISLRLRWAGILGATLTLVLSIGLVAIYAKQHAAVSGLAQDFGGSLSRMVAGESAENLLLGDRAATRALVEDIARNRQIHYLAIADRRGQVVASTRAAEIGHTWPMPAGKGDAPSVRERAGDMLVFDQRITYQAKTVGALRLGISNAPLREVQHTTSWVIAAVLAITLAAVVGAAYVLFRRLLNPLEVLGEALLRVARGDFHYRIRLVRRDEFGRLFATFNLMNGALEDRPPSTAADAAEPAAPAVEPTRLLHPPAAEDEPPA